MSRLTPSERIQLAELQARRGQLVREINDITRDLLSTQRSIKTLQDRLLIERDPAAKDLFVANITNLQQQEKRQTAELVALNQELQDIDAQIAQLTSPRPGQTAQQSSGIAVTDDAAAAVEGARTQNPVPPALALSDNEQIVDVASLNRPPSNASRPALADNEQLGLVDGSSTVGGSAPVRTAVRTQPGLVSPGDDARQIPTTPTGDAAGSTAAGRAPVAREFVEPIDARPNLLARLASMTYSVSIYLLNDNEYGQLLAQNRKVLPNARALIIQSGGIPQGDITGKGTRNPYFDVDFYIDDLVINNLVAGPAGVGAHTATTLDFTIVEPYGITFLPRLKAAVQNNIGATGPVNELSQNFLMVIRFYGYDDQGLLLSGSTLGVKETGSDTNSIVEKWIPFQITDLNFKIASKVTEYKVKAVVVDSNVAFSTLDATIPFNFELTSNTVQDLLNGQSTLVSAGAVSDANQSDAETARLNRQAGSAAPPKASAIPEKKTFAGGLCNALNQHEQDLVRREGYEIANRYVIELEDVPGLRDATIARPGRDDKNTSAMNKNQDAAAKYLSSKSSYQKDQKNFGVVAGTQIVQLIDLVMRTSSYITSQQNIIFDPKTGAAIEQTPVSTVQWYRIRSECRPLGYDRKRRGIAYEIRYIISRYQINDPRNAYFPNARFRGAHKIYNYWFTGLNTEVLDFNIDVNSQFFMTIGNDGKSVDPAPNAQYIERRAFQARPGQTTQPGSNEAGMPAANLADRIYSPIDVAQVTLDILGDPDWIQQSEVFYKGIDLKPFVQDGSVNYDSSEVLFVVNFNPVSDYDLSTGVMDSQKRNDNSSGLFAARPQQDIFRATEVQSNFRQGRFTQQIKGLITYFAANTTAATKAAIGAGDTGEIPGVTVFSGGSPQSDTGEIPGVTVFPGGSNAYVYRINQQGSNAPLTTRNNTTKNLDSTNGNDSYVSNAGTNDDAAGNGITRP
jgi:hypothetical protein